MRSLVASSATIVMDPTVAALLYDAQGFWTKENLGKWFSDSVEKTIGSLLGNGVGIGTISGMASQGLAPYATRIKQPADCRRHSIERQ
jgi:hypothetical protein